MGWLWGLTGTFVFQLLLAWLPLWGLCLAPVPAFVALVGLRKGPETGAVCGLLAGLGLYLAGGSPWQITCLAGLGCAGASLPRQNEILSALVALAGYEGLLLLLHWIGGQTLSGCVQMAGGDLLRAAVCLPPGLLLLHRRRHRWAVFP